MTTHFAKRIEDLVEVKKDLALADFGSFNQHWPRITDSHVVQALTGVISHPALGILEADKYGGYDDSEKGRYVLSQRNCCRSETNEA